MRVLAPAGDFREAVDSLLRVQTPAQQSAASANNFVPAPGIACSMVQNWV
jgi:hypothetical protein